MSKQGILLWITGLAGSGKTTIGKAVLKRAKSNLYNPVFIDGDIFRNVMGDELGHNLEDRRKNAWRIARLCTMLTNQGVDVICCTISLFREIHEFNQSENERLLEVYVDASGKELRRRDKKKLYSRSENGEVEYVTGVDQEYDRPLNPDLVLDNTCMDLLDANIESVINLIVRSSRECGGCG